MGPAGSADWHEEVGAKKQQRTKTFSVRGKADEFAAELEDDVRSGRYIDPKLKQRRFREAAEAWIGSKASIKGSPLRRYRRELDNFVLPKWGDMRLSQVTNERIIEWVRELSAGEAPFWFACNADDPDNPLRVHTAMAPSYVQHIVGRTFGGTLNYVVRQKWLADNPLTGVELPRIEVDTEEDLPSLTYAEAEAIAKEASEISGMPDDAVLARVLMYGAPRIGEATAFKVKDFDYAGHRLRVRRTWTVAEQGNRIIGPPKGWEQRWVPVPGFLAAELRELVKGRGSDEYLFQATRGGAINDRNWYNRVWVNVRKETGLATGYSVHALRHVAATFAISAGADVKLVQRMLGQKDATETLNTDAALWPDKVVCFVKF